MMNNEDIPRGQPQQQGRRPMLPGYNRDNRDNRENRYTTSPSPSTSYNYNGNSSYSNQQQHPRRRVDRFKRESLNSTDRLLRQNDIIIRLLKEIRDRLPPPPAAVRPEGETDEMERTDAPGMDQPEPADGNDGDAYNSAGETMDADQALPPLPPEP
jgi:hypothetical protein